MNRIDTRMPATKTMLIASAGITLVALALGFAISGVWLGAALSAAAVGLWLWSRRHEHFGDAFADIGLIAVFTLAMAGTLVVAPAVLMLLAGTSALVCWSLMRFEQRTAGVKRIDRADAIERQHLRLVLMAGAVGLAVAGLAATLRTNITFAAIFFIGLLVALLTSLVIGRWRTER